MKSVAQKEVLTMIFLKIIFLYFSIYSFGISVIEAKKQPKEKLALGSGLNSNENLRQPKSSEFVDETLKDYNDKNDIQTNTCWMKLDAKKHIEKMDTLDDEYAEARHTFNRAVIAKNIDQHMMEMMLKERAIAPRAVHNAGHPSLIPAGLNIGAYGMTRFPDSVLFFHRMKLRNNTSFRVNYLNNDMNNMVLLTRIHLNDLHLFGSYMRAVTGNDPSNLFYKPSFGELEFLLKDVYYKMEGRYRFVNGKLNIEHVISELHVKDALMMYVNGSTEASNPQKIPVQAIDDFIGKVKVDLDSWLQDYFNDYLQQIDLTSEGSEALTKYETLKLLELNDYMDNTLSALKQRLYSLTPPAADIKVPSFKLFSVTGIEIALEEGVLRNIDSFYRKSVATGRREEKIRKVDAVVGFSNLKLEYKYQARLDPTLPILNGMFVLSAHDLIAHFGMALMKEPESADLSFSYMRPLTSQSLVVEGAINQHISNFKYLLEDQILAIMSNTLQLHVKLLGTLTKCDPMIRGVEEPENESDEPRNKLTTDRNGEVEGMIKNLQGSNENGPPKVAEASRRSHRKKKSKHRKHKHHRKHLS